MTSIIPVPIFIGLKYYEMYNQLEDNRRYTLYAMLFLLAVSINVVSVYISMDGSQKILTNTQLWVYTFISWILFASIAVIVDIPTMQTLVVPFSNTIGYFMIKKKADVLISDMLANYENSPDKEVKRILRQINADNSLLLNSMTLTNARYIWTQFVGTESNDISTSDKMFEQLDGLLQYKYFIGKCVWYIYTGILVYFLLAYYNTKFKSSQP
jgi:hypothetical protein